VRYLSTKTEKPISKIGLGTWQFGSPEWNYGARYSAADARAIVARALELGVTLFDTAEIYGMDAKSWACRGLVRGVAVGDPCRAEGFGRSERILGEALAGRARQAFVATKFYPTVPQRPSIGRRAASSADRLGVTAIDLYQIHQPRLGLARRGVMDAVRVLQGLECIAEVGLSNATLEDWRAADDALGAPVLSNQVSYSLVDRAPEQELLPFAQAHDRVVIAFSPLAQGLLSGRYNRSQRPTNPARRASPLFSEENLDRAKDLLDTLRAVADAHGSTPAQVALAWVIRRPGVAAIPGAASVEQLEHNVAAADLELRDDEDAALTAASTAFRPVIPTTTLPERVARLGREALSRPGATHNA